MARLITASLPTLLVWMALSIAAVAQSVTAASVAYVQNNSLTITAKHGEVLNTVLMRPDISDFSVSRDRRFVVVISSGHSHGGDLELIDLRHRQRTKMISSPVYFTHLEEREKEIYADPQVSPDGKQVVFAVRLDSPGDANDAIDSAGPLAVLNFYSGDVRVVPSTTRVGQNGPCYASTPQWSPDGSQIVFNCKTGAAIAPLDGSKSRMLPIGTEQKPWSGVIGWLGSRCVLYVQAAGASSYDTYEVRLLNIVTNETKDASALVTHQRAIVAGLSEVASDAAISRTAQVTIRTPFNQWLLPKDSPAHLLGGWPRNTVPESCR